MALTEIKLLGDPLLLQKAQPVTASEIPELMPSIEKMWRLIIEFRQKYGRGRAIAAPQIGLLKRIICLNTDKKEVMINPVIEMPDDEMMEVWDDCMSFPNLFVRLKRYKRIKISFYDLEMKEHIRELEDDMSELLQHEYDHLDGVLAISRAEGPDCFKWVI